MNRKLTRTEWAAKFAAGLEDTARRYSMGLMSHATWRTHMRSLWDIVDARGLRTEVCTILGIDPHSPTKGALR